MSGISLFADTNIIIYILDGNEVLAEFLEGKDVKISFITEVELLSKPNLTISEKRKIKDFLSGCTIIDVTDEIKENTVRIRSGYKLKLPDALVAATAQYCNIPLISSDKIFDKVKEVETIIVKVK